MKKLLLFLLCGAVLFYLLATFSGAWGGAKDFVPRGQCGEWGSWLIYYQAANLTIAIAYLTIPLEIARRIKTVRSRVDTVSAFLFVAFILACGSGHLIDGVLMFYWPNYRIATIWHLCTAVISLFTAFLLPQFVHRMWQ